MAKRLSIKEKGFVKDVLKGNSGTQAVLNNYDTEDINTAAVIASENLRKPKIANLLEEALPDELLAQIHKEGLFATKPNFEKNDDGTYENVGDEPDYGIRHKYLDSAYKLKGSYAAEKHITTNVNVDLTPDLKALADKAAELLREKKT